MNGTKLWMRRPGLIVAAWIAFCAALATAGVIIDTRAVLPGPASGAELARNPGERLAAAAGIPPRDQLFLMVQSTSLPLDDPEVKRARDLLVRLLRLYTAPDGEPVFTRIQTVGHTAFDDELFTAQDRKGFLIRAESTRPINTTDRDLAALPAALADWGKNFPELRIAYLSEGTSAGEIFDLINRDLDHSLFFTLPLTGAILLFAFRSLVAAALPLALALTTLGAALGAAAIYSHIAEPICATATQLVVLLVLALGVDFSLFMVSRVREETARGLDRTAAIVIARSRVGRAILWSGVTVAVSLSGMLLMRDDVLRSMSVLAIIGVALILVGSLGVFPSLLVLLGEGLERGRTRQAVRDEHNFLSRWLRVSTRRPKTMLLASAAALAFVASFSFHLRLGSTVQPDILPRMMQTRAAYALLREQYPQFSGTDFSVILHAAGLEQKEEGIEELFDEMHAASDTVRGPLETVRSEDGSTARYQFVASGTGNDPQQHALIGRLRTELGPELRAREGIELYLSGTLPYIVDDNRRYGEGTPVVFAAVLLTSFLILLVAFRSLVIPLKAVLLNLLSTGAAFGILVLCFQALPDVPWHFSVIEAFIPALLFSILFGISMDYHLFLLSRVREEFLRGETAPVAVERGIKATASSITSAAAIMISVFLVIATLSLPVMKELGIGLAAAVLIDATVIRCSLLPASLVLLGKWNWYLPRWLSFLPEFRHAEEEAS